MHSRGSGDCRPQGAADAQHLATEFIARFGLEGQPFPAVAVSESIAALTLAANEHGVSQRVRRLSKPGDVLSLAMSV